MQTVNQDSSFDDVIVSFDPEIQELAQRLRELIETVHPEAFEVLWPKQKIAGFGVGPKKMTEHFSYIAPQTKHVNLGFYYGTSLSDPKGLLQGTGKAMRHVKVYSTADTEQPELQQLLKEAVAERDTALKKENVN